MPSNILTADTSFPRLTDQQSSDEKIIIVTNYLYMLLEQLRYTLANLGEENFNEKELENIANIITEPVYVQLKNAEGDIAALHLTAEGLMSRVSDAEGNISTLTQTSTSLMGRVSNAEGDIATLQLTANGLTSRITSAEGEISTLSQTVNGISLSVSNGTYSSTIKLLANGVAISSQTIKFTGIVTFDDLETEGTTTIHGGNIDTDTLKVSNLFGRYVYLYDSDEEIGGRFSITNATTADCAVTLLSYGALDFYANAGDVYLEDGDGEYLHISTGDTAVVIGNADLIPNRNGVYALGGSTHLWSDIYCENDVIQTSDLTKKHDVVYGLEAFDEFFDSLKPMSHILNNGTSGRRHHGLGAQDVEQDLIARGFTSMDFAGLIKSPKKDEDGNVIEGEYDYGLRYGEFIPMTIDQVQRTKRDLAAAKEEISKLNKAVAALKEEIAALKAA